MNRPVVFNSLWILSERDESARHLTFSPGTNLLEGSNDTGKSRVLKHLVWALGCEPARRAAGDFDSNVVASVDLTVGKRNLTFLRQNRRRAAFDDLGLMLFATESASDWAEFFAYTFDFPLKLQRHEEGKFAYAGPSYSLLPFYVDQDNGWGTKWATFTNLTQFAKWQDPVFNAFTGLRPAAYVRNQLLRDEAAYRLRMAKAEAKLQDSAFKRVVEMLPAETAAIDETQFAHELKSLSTEAQELRKEQDDVRVSLVELAQDRQQKTTELNLALASERDLVEDQAYLAGYKDDAPLVCPTCSHVHTTSFYSRQLLAQDAHDIHQVVIRCQTQLDALKAKELVLQRSLTSVALKLRALNESLNVKQGGRAVADVVVAKSLLTLKQAYDATRRDLAAEIDTLTQTKDALNEQLAALTDKGREKRIKEFFAEELISVADRLDINKAEISSRVKFSSRSPNASGSNAPRAVLAMHVALVATHAKYGEGPTFPFIVDTPQQSGQDPVSLGRMLDAILGATSTSQTMVATESIPQGWQAPDGCTVLRFEKKRRLLRREDFVPGVLALKDMVTTMNEAILKAAQVPEDDLEGTVPPPDAEEDDE